MVIEKPWFQFFSSKGICSMMWLYRIIQFLLGPIDACPLAEVLPDGAFIHYISFCYCENVRGFYEDVMTTKAF